MDGAYLRTSELICPGNNHQWFCFPYPLIGTKQSGGIY